MGPTGQIYTGERLLSGKDSFRGPFPHHHREEDKKDPVRLLECDMVHKSTQASAIQSHSKQGGWRAGRHPDKVMATMSLGSMDTMDGRRQILVHGMKAYRKKAQTK